MEIGNRYGKLTVVAHHVTTWLNGRTRSSWKCKCDCGARIVSSGTALRDGTINRCIDCSTALEEWESPVLPVDVVARNAIISEYRSRARRHGRMWELSTDYAESLFQGNCVYCGTPPSTFRRVDSGGGYLYNGIDRVDSDGGYTVDNVVTCCMDCNYAKRAMSVDEFKEWITRAYTHITNIGWR